MKNVSIKALAVAAALVATGPVRAATLNVDSGWSDFAFGAVGTTATKTFDFTIVKKAFLTVADGFFSGDRFEVFANAISLGQTSAPVNGGNFVKNNFDAAAASSSFSSGRFLLGPGTYTVSFDVTEVTSSPKGRNNIGAVRLDTAAVPVPASGIMLLAGLGAAALFGRRRRTT